MSELKQLQFPAIFTQLVRDFIDQYIDMPGVDLSLSHVFKLVQIPTNTIEDPHSSLNGKQIEVLLSIGRLLSDKSKPFSFQLIDLFKEDTLGIFGLALINSSTGKEAIHIFKKFAYLYMPAFDCDVETTQSELTIRITPKVKFDKAVEKTLIEMFFASFAFYMDKIGMEYQTTYKIPFEIDHDVSFYQDYLKGEIITQQPEASITYPISLLDEINPRANQAMQKIYVEQLEQQHSDQQNQLSFSERARKILKTQALKGHYLSRSELADEMACSERTLTRKLKAEGQAFQSLLDHERANIAKELLRSTNKTTQQIAITTGIQNSAVFCRAFKKWTGSTPSEYREAFQNN